MKNKVATPFSWPACTGEPFRGVLEKLMAGRLPAGRGRWWNQKVEDLRGRIFRK
jgi:hypothetical protein